MRMTGSLGSSMIKLSKARYARTLLLTWFVFYTASWFLTYSVVMEFDYRFFFSYLKLAWLGGLELPSFIQFTALASSVLFTAIFLFFRHKTQAKSIK